MDPWHPSAPGIDVLLGAISPGAWAALQPQELLQFEQALELQHSAIFRLAYAFMQTREVPALRQRVQDLFVLAQEHFAFEEALMGQLDFRDLKEHARSHARLLDRLATLHQRISGDVLDKMEMAVFLKHWSHAHLMLADARFSEFLHGGAGVDSFL